jgi:ABC-type branched-subunit amino acid transport system ATPase component/ABC-type branched-subunit amino acid transport system permease subunit
VADRSKRLVFLAAIIGAVILAALPLGLSAYGVSTGIVYFANIALATAWALFSGPTRYISLATAAFVGVGMYTVAIAHVSLNLAVCLALAAIIGFFFAVVVGLSTLRLRGVYFVIFTFGLTELMRQVSSWYEINITNKLNRFITISIDSIVIYEMLLVLAVVAVVGSWYVSAARLGYALRAIGEDETVAWHTGIDATWIKVLVFAIAASMMSLVGAVYALRYPSIDPTVGFGNGWSFQVLIAALLGGPGRPWGPAIGAVLLVLLSDFLVGTFSRYFTIALGVCFVVIVYFIPGGIAPRIEQLYGVLARARQAARSASGAPAPQEPPTDAAIADNETEMRAVVPRRRSALHPLMRRLTRSGPRLLVRDGVGPPPGAMLSVHGLRKAFGGLIAVRDLSFDIPAGGITGLIGPNGSGKTTVLNLITGELPPDAGSIVFQGDEIIGVRSFEICRARIARTFQLVRILPGMTTRENVMLGRMFGSDPTGPAAALSDADALLDRVGLADRAQLIGSQLTYIDQKRVELARALATRPQLLLLDEWLAGLNPTELKIGIDLIRRIQREGITVLMVEHVMEAIRALCGHVVVMSAGMKIAEGTAAEVLSDSKVAQVYLGDDDAAA